MNDTLDMIPPGNNPEWALMRWGSTVFFERGESVCGRPPHRIVIEADCIHVGKFAAIHGNATKCCLPLCNLLDPIYCARQRHIRAAYRSCVSANYTASEPCGRRLERRQIKVRYEVDGRRVF